VRSRKAPSAAKAGTANSKAINKATMARTMRRIAKYGRAHYLHLP
jgi:hypothetical protein